MLLHFRMEVTLPSFCPSLGARGWEGVAGCTVMGGGAGETGKELFLVDQQEVEHKLQVLHTVQRALYWGEDGNHSDGVAGLGREGKGEKPI